MLQPKRTKFRKQFKGRNRGLAHRAFPDKPITKKPLEVRQGKGKGNVEYWVALVQPGRLLYEIAGVTEEVAREAFALASAKLPVGTAFVERHGG
jgi:large subunit ribosomal protein L16